MTPSTYSDLDFFIAIETSGQPVIRVDEEAINQSIRTILTTRIGERIMEPEFGTRLRALLFNPMDALTVIGIEEVIRYAIEQWEPRVLLGSIDVNADEENNVYDISIVYTIKEIRKSATFRFALASRHNS